MRRALLISLLLAGLLAPAARAQDATPVVGGGSFNTAPLIGAGSYRDTLLPGERLFYGVKLGAGQRLRVSGRLDPAGDPFGNETVGFSVGMQTPLREVDVLDLVDQDIAGNGTVTLGSYREKIEFVSTPVMTASAARADSGPYRGPGTWYVSLYLSSTEQDPPKIEVPVDMKLQVIGDPQPDPSPEPTVAKATPAPADNDSGGGTSLGAILAVGLGGLAVGAALGVAAAALTRRRRRTA